MQSIFINNTIEYNTNKTVNTTGNQVSFSLNPRISLDDDKKYQLRLLSASIVYCMPNINQTKNNNTLKFGWVHTYIDPVSKAQKTDTYTNVIVLEDGLYSVDDLNEAISEYTIKYNNGYENVVYFEPEESTSKIYLKSEYDGITIIFSQSTLLPMLGFTTSTVMPTYSGKLTIKSTNQAVLSSLQNILVKCDCTAGAYFNSNQSTIIASITPNVLPYHNIAYEPYHPIRCSVNKGYIENMTITLVDQDNNPIDMGSMNGTHTPEAFSMVLTIEPITMLGIL